MNKFDDHDDDLFDEPTSKATTFTKLMIAVVAFLFIGGGVYLYNSYKERRDSEMLLITVEPEEIKVQPIEPGGMVVENMDKSVYEAIEKKPHSENKVEVILQPTEEPIDKKEIEKAAAHDDEESEKQTEQKAIVAVAPSVAIKTKQAKKEADWDFEEEYIKPVAKESTIKPKFVEQETKSYKVQLAAFKSSKEAETQWNFLLKKHSNIFKAYDHFVVSKNIPGKGIFYRLQVGPFKNMNDAKDACKTFKDLGINCFAVKP